MQIQLKEINKKYDDRIVFDSANLVLETNKIYGLVAPNGRGKTTLLNLISHLILPNSGEIEYLDCSFKDVDIIFGGDRGLYLKNTVKENLYYFAALKNVRKNEVDNNINKNQELFYTYFELKDKLCEKLSLGQKRIIKILISIAINSKCLLIDEANAGLDYYYSADLNKLLKKISKDKIILIASHDLNFISKTTEEYIFIKDKKIINNSDMHGDIITNYKKIYGEIPNGNI